jgi:hypothetical protein
MIEFNWNKETCSLDIEAYLINCSNTATIPLFELAQVLKQQIESVYNVAINDIELKTKISIIPLYHYRLKQLHNHLVFAISDNVTNDNIAEAYQYDSLVKLNTRKLQAILSNKNTRTVPHETGHLFGWDHPHANGEYQSINTSAHLLEQQLTETERAVNLMSQTWYIQRSGLSENDGKNIALPQLELLKLNYTNNAINKQNKLIKRWFRWYWGYGV